MISPEVVKELLSVRQVLHYLPASPSTEMGWTPEESQLFWVALAKYPQGPWTTIAEYIGTKSTRQAMTHGQKLRQKFKRWNKRLRSNPVASSLMDGITVAPSGDIEVTSDVATAPSPLTSGPGQANATTMTTSYPPQGQAVGTTVLSFPSNQHCSVLVDDISIISEEKADGSSVSPHDVLTMPQAYSFTADASGQRPHYAAAAVALPPLCPGSTSNVRSTLTGVVGDAEPAMPLDAEADDAWVVSEFANDAEILPQDLLDELAEMLSDEDLDELSHRHENGQHC